MLRHLFFMSGDKVYLSLYDGQARIPATVVEGDSAHEGQGYQADNYVVTADEENTQLNVKKGQRFERVLRDDLMHRS